MFPSNQEGCMCEHLVSLTDPHTLIKSGTARESTRSGVMRVCETRSAYTSYFNNRTRDKCVITQLDDLYSNTLIHPTS